jgi:hypothetical protein
MAGSLTHFVFMMKVLVPFKRPVLAVEPELEGATPALPSCISLPQLQGESA